MDDYLGNLYTKVCDYLWEGSKTVPHVVGIGCRPEGEGRNTAFGVKPFNFVRWDNATAEARFSKRENLLPADLPLVEVLMEGVRPENFDSCVMKSQIDFSITVASGSWKITNATKLYNQITALISILQHTNEMCGWDIGKPDAVAGFATFRNGTIQRNPEISKNQSGFTFDVNFSIEFYVQYKGDAQ